jgi:hypothetical protein
MHPGLPRLRDLLLTATALGVAPVAAGPEGCTVVGGAPPSRARASKFANSTRRFKRVKSKIQR